MFSIKPDGLNFCILPMENIEKELRDISSKVSDVTLSRSMNSEAYDDVLEAIRSRNKYIQSDADAISDIWNGLDRIIRCYRDIDQNIVRNGKGIKKQKTIKPMKWESGFNHEFVYDTLDNDHTFSRILPSGAESYLRKYEDKLQAKADSWKEEKSFKKTRDKEHGWRDTAEVEEEEKKAKENKPKDSKLRYLFGSLANSPIFKAEGEGEFKLWEANKNADDLMYGSKDGSHVSANASLLQANYNADAFISAGGVGASAGFSACVFTAYEEAQLGNEMFGTHEKVEVTAGKIAAQGDVKAQWINQDGHFDPALYGGVSAEAIAGEIKGTAGLNILGADASVSGSLNYGIGCHAKAGYNDGKLEVDIGATLGVGVSLQFSIDASGTVNAVKGLAKSVLGYW